MSTDSSVNNSSLGFLDSLLSIKHFVNATTVNLLIVFAFTYYLTNKILKYIDQRNNIRITSVSSSNNKCAKVEDEVKKSKEDDEKEEDDVVDDDDDEEVASLNHPKISRINKPGEENDDDFVCPFSLMSLKQLEKMKVEGELNKLQQQHQKFQQQHQLQQPQQVKMANGGFPIIGLGAAARKRIIQQPIVNKETMNATQVSASVDDDIQNTLANKRLQALKEEEISIVSSQNSEEAATCVDDEIDCQKKQLETIFKLLKETETEENVGWTKPKATASNKLAAETNSKENNEEENIKTLIESQMRLYGLNK